MGETMIQVDRLVKRYGGVKVLHDVSFSIQKGEVVGFLGPNGAGKTTTMRILTGYIPPSSGKVVIAGLDVQEFPLEIRKKIGYLPESVPLYNEMTVEAYLHLMGELKGLQGALLKEHMLKAMQECSVLNVRNKVIDTLSKGYRQRVGIAQALLGDPEILILDEPTVGLDPNQIIEIRSLIKKLGKERTVILSTHILPEVSQTCSRVMIINEGSIVASGTPESLTAKINTKVTISVKVLGDDIAGLTSVLEGVNKAISHVSVESVEKGILGATLQISAKEEVRPLIAKAILKGKFDLIELHTESLGLEDLFLKLTN